jgi:hypothetical protein
MGFECCYCWEYDSPTNVRFDIHEIIISRGAATRASLDAQLAIHDPRNCGWVHRICHSYTEGGDGRIRAIVHLLRYEGYTNVMSFIRDEMSHHFVDFMQYARDINVAYDRLVSA